MVLETVKVYISSPKGKKTDTFSLRQKHEDWIFVNLEDCQVAVFSKGWHTDERCQKEMEYCRKNKKTVLFLC